MYTHEIIYAYRCTYMYIYVYVCICVWIYMCIYMYVYVYLSTWGQSKNRYVKHNEASVQSSFFAWCCAADGAAVEDACIMYELLRGCFGFASETIQIIVIN